jgi:integrase
MPNSTKCEKISKPRPDFPLFPHATGRWAKKVRGKFQYFGKTADDPQGEKALNLWLDQKDELLAGRTPRTGVGITVEDVCNQFLAHKDELRLAGEITERTFNEYESTGKRIAVVMGHKTPITAIVADDFRHLRAGIAKVWGPVRLANEIQRVRGVFKYAYDSGLIAQPVRFGPDFTKPSRKVMRQARAARGLRMFEREELLAVLDVASVNAKAMILLGINGGMGNSDVAHLPIKAVNLKTGWLDYPRPKTAIERRIPLWPETIAALKAAQAERPEPKDAADKPLFFINPFGRNYSNANASKVGHEMRFTLEKAGIRRKSLSFYALRHNFQTVAEEARDMPAVQKIMGHAAGDHDMSAVYREKVTDERLQAVVNRVRQWLFGVEKPGRKK